MNKNRSHVQVSEKPYGFLFALALVLFVCGLWPVVLIIVLGIIITGIGFWLFKPGSSKVETKTDMTPSSIKATPPITKNYIHSGIVKGITELVQNDYPNSRWIWECSNAYQLISQGEDVYILLNRAGGYRKAKVIISENTVVSIQYLKAPSSETKPVINIPQEELFEKDNYGLLAFEWVEANILNLNQRFNEAIGDGITEMLIHSDELPVIESWTDICNELIRAGISNAKTVPEGIKINLMFEKQKGNQNAYIPK